MNSSPDRHTFQAEAYTNRCKEEGREPSEDYLNLYKSYQQQDKEKILDPEWQKDNMEYDLRSTQWICDKAKASDAYAQNIYAAICNNDFTKNEAWPLLQGKTWSASWRSAGGIVAHMIEEGDYMDWYCSGIRNDPFYDSAKHITYPNGYAPESVVTDEIRNDLLKLGWIVVDSNNNY